MKPRELVPPVFFRLLSPRLLDGLRERGRLYYVMFCFMRCVGCRSDIGGYFGVLYPAPPRSDLTVMPPEGCNAYHAACFFRMGSRKQAAARREAERVAEEWWTTLERRIAAMTVDELWRLEDRIEAALANRKGRP